ncbi:MAG: flippase-like domain-containing protein [Akkermansiaceae bacterium]|nr:flippase-like domain-containing protein [Akkermansiaceae bacterium]
MKKGRAKSLGIFALKLAGTVLFLWWALSQVEDKDALWNNFRLALGSPGWVAVGLGFAFLSLLANALRWQFLLMAQSIRQPFSYILRLTLYGAFFNIASLGGAAGDAAKIVLLIRRVPGKKVGITMSVMVDHIVGFISSGIIFLVFTWGFGTIDSADDVAGRGTFVAATWFQAMGIVGIVLSVLSCSPGMLKWGRKVMPKITNNRWVDMITSALDLYRTGWKFVFYSLLASFVLSASFYLTFFAGLRSLDQPVGAAEIMSVMPIVDVVTALPISVSGLGVRERTFDFLIGKLTGIPTSAAVAGSLIGFLFTLFWGLVGGLAILTARSDKKAVEAISND